LLRGLTLQFPTLTWRWIVGLPGDASTTNIHLEGEGSMLVAVQGKLITVNSFDATVGCMSEVEINALLENVTKEEFTSIAAAFGLVPQVTLADYAFPAPYACHLAITPSKGVALHFLYDGDGQRGDCAVACRPR
jgi:hypothetical protein